jgi:CRISPR system Cascade subunit CasE
MHFSVLAPQPGHEHAALQQRAHDDAYGDHQWLWRLFAAPAGTPRDFLFRRQEVQGVPRYHLVSRRPPQSPGPDWQLQIREYAPQLLAGERLSFELCASPTVRHDRTGKSQRHDVVVEAKKKLLAERGLSIWADWVDADRPALYDLVQSSCVAWLAKRGARGGFELDASRCVAMSYQQYGRRSRPGAEAGLQFSTVELAGELTVRDPDAFAHVLFNGLGSAKAFGCGLLLVRRSV